MRAARIVFAVLILGAGPQLAAQGVGPGGATARCQDGAFSHSKIQSEACRDHDGLQVWYGLAQNEAVAAAKRADIYTVLEDAMTREAPNIIARADLAGTIQDRFTADSAEIAQNPSFMVYLDRVRQLSGCRKKSNHCALCPGARQIYCTNIPAFLPLTAF